MTDQHEQLRARLARLRREGGDVSTREIARRSHGAVSHTTVHQVLRGKSVPSWRSLAAIVAVLGGDEGEFKLLWMAARDAEEVAQPVEEGGPTWLRFREYIPAEHAALLNIARIYHDEGKIADCEQVLTGHLNAHVHPSPTIVGEFGRMFWYHPTRGEDVRNSYRDLVERIAFGPDYPDETETSVAAMWFARKCLEFQNVRQAMVWAQRARCLNPHWPMPMRLHGELLLLAGDYERAADILLAAQAVDPAATTWFMVLSDSLKLTGRFDALEEVARDIYARQLKSGGSDVGDAVNNLIEVLRLNGKVHEAKQLSRTRLDSYGGNAIPEYHLLDHARLLEEVGEVDEAKELLRSSYSPDSDYRSDFKAAYANLVLRVDGREAGMRLLVEWHRMESGPS
ncbi:hypothetical protein ACFZB4_16050 [Streptomyces pseudovenezuelae]|uniref:hypothetical protein n=1 Tax=Streptomyces pseudovenezuelae TaxID=67350 RepID=UPI0036E5EC8E